MILLGRSRAATTVHLLTCFAGSLALAGCGSSSTTPGNTPSAPTPSPPTPATPGSAPFRLVQADFGALPASVLFGRSMEATMADLDRDDDLDIVVAREFEAALILINDGTGRFTDDRSRLPQVVRDYEDIAIADFDRDGDLDLVLVAEDDIAGTGSAPKHQYYLNDGTGRFTDASARITVSTLANAVAAGDIDADGDADLVLGNRGEETVLLNDGTGRFSPSAGAVPARGDDTQDVVLGDLDGDTDLDLTIGNESGGPNVVLLNDGRGRFSSAPSPLPSRAAPEATRNVSLADIDADGDLDMAFANVIFAGGNPRPRLLRNVGGGRFEDITDPSVPASASGFIDFEFGDVDSDGDPDLVGTSFPINTLGLYLNDGRGSFTAAPAGVFPAPILVQGVEVEIGDVNGDRRRDVYVATFIESADVLLLNRP
jgi:hypothetical protein